MFSWLAMVGFAKYSFVLELCLVLLTWNAIAAFSEESVAKFVRYYVIHACLGVCNIECNIVIRPLNYITD